MPNNEIGGQEKEHSKFGDLVARTLITVFFVAICLGVYRLFILFCNKGNIPKNERKNVGIAILVFFFVVFYILGLIL